MEEPDKQKLAIHLTNIFGRYLTENHPEIAKDFSKFKIILVDDEIEASLQS